MFRIFGHYVSKELFLLCSTEVLILLISVYMTMSSGLNVSAGSTGLTIWLQAFIVSVVMLTAMVSMGMYHRVSQGGLASTLGRIILSFTLGAVLLAVIYMAFSDSTIDRGVYGLALGFAFISIVACRLVWQFRANRVLKQRTLIIGIGKKAKEVLKITRMSDAGIRIVGFVDAERSGTNLVGEDKLIDIKQDFSDLHTIIQQNKIKEIVIALDERRNKIPADEILECKMQGVRVVDVNYFLERQLGKISLDTLHPSALIYSQGFVQGKLKSAIKRAFDVVVASAMLVATLPIMLLTALAIKLESGWGGSVLYIQERVGANNKPFKIFKFRSMTENAESNGQAVWAQKNDSRVTKVGNFIRKTRIDELPQLYNVLKGNMSFVGPRPERPQFVGELSDQIAFYGLRHHAKPGITGWAQICYPYGASVEDSKEKLEYDLYYLKHNTVFLDLLILMQTAAVIFLAKGR